MSLVVLINPDYLVLLQFLVYLVCLIFPEHLGVLGNLDYLFLPLFLEHLEPPVILDCLERLAKDGQLTAYRHEGFWQCMDTLRDKRFMERLWEEGRAPWKVWA